MTAVKDYLSEHLRFTSEAIQQLGEFTAERIPYGPRSKNKSEMVLRFRTTEARDLVKGAAQNLAGKSNEYAVRHEGPAAGVLQH